MVKDGALLEKFELDLAGNAPVDIKQNFKLANSMYQMAKNLGLFPLKDPLEGIDRDIALTKAFNSVRRASR